MSSSSPPDQTTTNFGLPLELEEIAPLDEFAPEGEIVRSIGLTEQCPDLDEMSFDIPLENRRSFLPSPALFATPKPECSAPPLPDFVRPSRTSFLSNKFLPTLVREIQQAFASTSVSASEVNGCSWECSALNRFAVVTFAVRIFELPGVQRVEHLVELHHLSGCRHSFSEVASNLASELRVSFGSAKRSLSDSGLSSSSSGLMAPPPSLRRAEISASSLSQSGGQEASATYLMSLLAPGSSPEHLSAGCRVVGSSASAQEPVSPAIEARVVELTSATNDSDDEVRAVAFAAAASLAAFSTPCDLFAVVDAAASGVVGGEEETDLIHAHVLREALRLTTALFSGSAACDVREKLTAVDDFIETTARVADAPTGSCPDVFARSFAQGALLACGA